MSTTDDSQTRATVGDELSRALTARLRDALSSPAARRIATRAPYLAARAVICVGDEPTWGEFTRGDLALKTDAPLLYPWDFAIRGSVAGWSALWQPVPAPGWHDLFALSKRGEMRFEGNLHPFLAHLQLFKDLLALPRGEPGR